MFAYNVYTWCEGCLVAGVDVLAGSGRIFPGTQRGEQPTELVKQRHTHALRVEVSWNLQGSAVTQ